MVILKNRECTLRHYLRLYNKDSPPVHSTPITPAWSFYLPPCEDTFRNVSFDDVQVSQNRPLDALNAYLVSRDVGKDKWTDKALLYTES